MSNFNYMDPLLYSPAFNPEKPGPEKLLHYANGNGEGVFRTVICTEDAMLEEHMQQGFANIQTVFNEVQPNDATKPTELFVRVKNIWVLEHVLAMDGLKNLKGFVLPKITPDNYAEYADMIGSVPGDFEIMPILESRGIFDNGYQRDILQTISHPTYRPQISCVRFGLKDLMGELKLTRDFNQFLYDNDTVSELVGHINREFTGVGDFPVTAPVFGSHNEAHLPMFDAEVDREVMRGNFGKTTVFPKLAQRAIEHYKVSEEQYDWAQNVMDTSTPAVHKNHNGIMVETAPDRKSAPQILARAVRYGIRPQTGSGSEDAVDAA